MILSLRDKLQGTVAFVLVAIIAIPFALFGIDSLFLGGGNEQSVANVNKVPITESRLQQAVAMQKQQLLARLGETDPSLIDEKQLRDPVLERLIRQEALRQGAIDSGIGVAPQAIQLTLRDEPAFQTDGRFDRNRFEFMVRQMGHTPTGYLELIKEELVTQQVYQAIAYSEFTAQHEIDSAVGLLAEQRDLAYILIPRTALTVNFESDEESLRSFYEEHASNYIEPEKLILEVIELNMADLAADIDVSPAEIEGFFDDELGQLPDNRGWEVAHILLAGADVDDPRLETIRVRLAAGEDFEDLAREFSDDSGSARQGGALGFGGEDDFPAEFVTVLESMAPEEVSQPVETGNGMHLIKLLATSAGDEKPELEAESERIATELRQLKAREKMVNLVDRLREQSYNAVTLRDVADNLELPYTLSSPISREQGGEGVVGHPRVLAAAYSQDVYEDDFASEVLELAPDQVVVIKIAEKIPARQLDFSEVEDSVESAWRQTQARSRVLKAGRTLMDNLNNDPEQAQNQMAELGVEWQSLEGVVRGDPRLPGEIQGVVFSLAADSQEPLGRLLPSGDFAIVRLDDVHAGDAENLSSGELTQLRAQLINDRATRAIEAVERRAVADAKVKFQ